MKKLLILTILGSLLIFASSAMAGITGSAHDFTKAGGFNSGGEICVACHTPHNADATVSDAPLWNHEVTAASFTLYTSTTLDATAGQPAGISKLCLSCHDGTVALDSYGGGPDPSISGMITGNALIGTSLTNDHPVSFTYNTALATADGGLHNPSVKVSGLAGGGTVEADLLFGSAGSAKVECASCHDVHREDETILSLLRIDNAGSTLCLTCHDK